MTQQTIAYQGAPGANSHMACQQTFADWQTLPCASFEDTLAAVHQSKAQLAMIPIENSLGGRVADIHHLLPESRLFIIGEHFHPVHHHLLAPPKATLESLKSVYSHPQALAQCRGHIRELKLEPVSWPDTADAAREVAERGDPTVGAIASGLAGETYGLVSLRSRLEDKLGNTTRFIIMAPQRSDPPPDTPSIISMIFQVRSVPAALYKSLAGFATHGINRR